MVIFYSVLTAVDGVCLHVLSDLVLNVIYSRTTYCHYAWWLVDTLLTASHAIYSRATICHYAWWLVDTLLTASHNAIYSRATICRYAWWLVDTLLTASHNAIYSRPTLCGCAWWLMDTLVAVSHNHILKPYHQSHTWPSDNPQSLTHQNQLQVPAAFSSVLIMPHSTSLHFHPIASSIYFLPVDPCNQLLQNIKFPITEHFR